MVKVGSKDDKRTPKAPPFSNPTVGKKNLLLLKDDLGFMRPATWLEATSGLGAPCVNGEFETPNGFAHASFAENIPAFLSHCFDFAASGESSNLDALVKLRRTAGAIPEVDVSASRGNGSRDATNRVAMLCEDK